MSDLLAITGWIGEHPSTGGDVAHLLVYAATDYDTETPEMIETLAELLGAADVRGPRAALPILEAVVNLDQGTLDLGNGSLSLPEGWQDEWGAIASSTGMAILSLASQPLSHPTAEVVHELVASGQPLWVGRIPIARF